MSTETKKKAFLIAGNSTSEALDKLRKAIANFYQLEEITVDSVSEKINQPENPDSIFIFEINNLISKIDLLKTLPAPRCMVFSIEKIHMKNLQLQASNIEVLTKIPFLNLADISAGDLVRILFHFFSPAPSGGVISLVEKNSLILAEKIQDPSHIGETIDFLSAFLQREHANLFRRIHDVRQLITGITSEAFQLEILAGSDHPTVDLQVAVNETKLAVSMRFSLSQTSFPEIIDSIIQGTSLPLSLSWIASDALIIFEHPKFNELEIKCLFYSDTGYQSPEAKTILHKKVEKEIPKSNLLLPPQNFQFSLISNLKNFKTSKNTVSTEDQANPNDEKIAAERAKLNQLIEQKELALREASGQLSKAKFEIVKTKNMALDSIREQDQKVKLKEKIILDLEKKIKILETTTQTPQEKASSNETIQAILKENEQKYKALDVEKNKLKDTLTQSQKKIALLEQKSTQKEKDFAIKEKEFNDLKALSHRLQQLVNKSEEKENEAKKAALATAAAAANATKEKQAAGSLDKELAAKIKELEQKEVTYKQEAKKLQFKADSVEKTVKAIKDEAAEKIKLMERKLEGAKTKEIELLKKIEELNAAIKKNSKAA